MTYDFPTTPSTQTPDASVGRTESAVTCETGSVQEPLSFHERVQMMNYLQQQRGLTPEQAEQFMDGFMQPVADIMLDHKTKGITWVIVGADCIAANGDVIGKIGTYQLAVCAMHHGVRFMVVAPSSTLDLMMATGDDVALEERDTGELLEVAGQRFAADVSAYNPVFDEQGRLYKIVKFATDVTAQV